MYHLLNIKEEILVESYFSNQPGARRMHGGNSSKGHECYQQCILGEGAWPKGLGHQLAILYFLPKVPLPYVGKSFLRSKPLRAL